MKYLADRRIILAFGFAALILGSVGFTAYQSTRRLIASESWVEKTESTLDNLTSILQQTLEVESAARGYVLSGKDLYLDPYYQAIGSIKLKIGRMEDSIGDNPGARPRVESLKDLILKKIDYHQRQVDVRANAGFEESRKLFGAGEGHEMMDRIRTLAQAITADETRLLQQRRREAKSAATISIYSLIFGPLLSFAILLAVYRNLNKEVHLRKKSETDLRRLNRLQMVLAHSSQAVVQLTDRHQLAAEVCRIAVEEGRLQAAWIGSFDADPERMTVEACYGADEGFASAQSALIRQGQAETAGIGTTLAEGRDFLCNDIRNHPILAAAAGAYESMAAFPIRFGGALTGSLCVYAAAPEYFNAEISDLLRQIAANLSLGLEAIEFESARRNAEEEIRKLNEDLEHRVAERTQQLAAANLELAVRNREIERADRLKSEFLASMSHELRTPLNAIVGFSDLLAEESAGPLVPKQRRFLEHIRTGSTHLLQLINDILDISRIEAGRVTLNPEYFQAAEAANEVLSVVSPLAVSKKIAVECRIGASLRIQADRIRFKQILYNLLSNAVKFTPENGKVWIDSRREEDGAECFSVQDTGVGIPIEEQQAIFDEFHQAGAAAKGAYQGSGLGLAITRRLVKLHRGNIWLESRPDMGSTFYFTIPAGLTPDAAEYVRNGIPERSDSKQRTSDQEKPL